MSARVAKQCFLENLKCFAPCAENDPEKYNLYNGLVNLAEAMDLINVKLGQIGQRQATFAQRLSRSQSVGAVSRR